MAIFNGKEILIQSQSSIRSFLKDQGICQFRGIAIAVNQQVVPKSEWEDHKLNQTDQILLIKAAQGG